ncbi:alkanesulfonates ABC transporter ATP-binding protein [Liquorilactobacillus sucicola DSM 21376 = JCM 15457]|uniref:Aliphatic sulfonates import ATP-binding protein ssuB n=1 Tax=Liquorilactobacillus sucicola DSM 21376 = JCM 15457 TaxID=1423806 RepID=A0A023D067_9LACO|nr:ABC transporter ATP-binding protein [Liquorilactobacillus sucicola]KRN07382.1 Aliphatic sulfonates import ATP-binding protein ssuB [Liquorilactobacillus sucicola DSM 21376 = JCM 15457]GAJ27527.1 alkanesulfonates ABC transporter ATP-binding protein [Liquorilactobacillus sucicola DSM 21376 = JCM 15457]
MVQLAIRNVSRTLQDNNGQPLEILKDINFQASSGEFISIIGPSGCGKTTLLRLISGLDTPEKGDVTVDGNKVTAPNVSRGYVFQHGSLFPWETIEENISSGLKALNGRNYDKELVQHYIELMGLKGFESSYPHQVSGGMAQRAALARSIVMKPKLLLLDEPMGALDAFTRADVQEVIHQVWQQTKTTMVLVTHDIDEAIYLSTRIIIMTPRPGEIKEIVTNPLDFPRNRTSTEFMDLRKIIQDKLNFY